MNRPVKNPESKVLIGYLIDAAGPVVAYFILHSLGVSDLGALIIGSLIALTATVVNTIRNRRLDSVGILVLVEIAASIGLLFLTRDPRILLIKPSFYTGIGAIYVMGSAFAPRPLSYVGSEPMARKGGPARLAAYHRAWERSPGFRGLHRAVTFSLGAILIVDAILRVVVVYSFPLSRSMWLGNLPNLVAMGLLAGVSALAGRRFAGMVDRQQQLASDDQSLPYSEVC